MTKRGIKRLTSSKERYPETGDFVTLAQTFCPDAIKILWNCVWQGYDNYHNKGLQSIGRSEREITQNLAIDINDNIPDGNSFVCQHERYQDQEGTEKAGSGRPKQPDLSFVFREYSIRKFSYPIEAKILKTDGQVAEYIKEINNNFLTCRYAPFSSEGGMLGYLLKGSPDNAFNNIAKKTPCQLSHHPDFPNRHHKTSDHQRTVPQNQPYPQNFRCHHLILEIS